MNILAVDYGQKRIGLAFKARDLEVIFPYGIIINNNIDDSVEKLKDLILEKHVDLVIFGLPLSLNGQENNNTKRVRSFADLLQLRMPSLIIDFIDERFTTKESEKDHGAVSLDEKSAMLILESYLQEIIT